MVYVKNMHYGRSDLEMAALALYLRNLKIEPDERVAILYDGLEDGKRIVDALYKVGNGLCADGCVDVVGLESYRTRDASSPIGVRLDCDVILAVTGKSVTHAKEVVDAISRGARGFSMPGVYARSNEYILKEYNFVRPANTNIGLVSSLADCVEEHLRGLDEITIYTGPDDMYQLTLQLDRENNKPFNDNGQVPKRDGYGRIMRPGIIRNWPFGEYAVLPKYRRGAGDILVNLSSETDSPFLLHMENGEIVGWDENAKPFVELLNKHKGGRRVAELGFGTSPDVCFGLQILNPKDTLSNEKMAYTLHLAFGDNTNFGGINCANIHKDGIIIKPRLFSGGREIKLWACYDRIILPGRPDFSEIYPMWNPAALCQCH